MAKVYLPYNDDTRLYTIALLSILDEMVLVTNSATDYTIPIYFGQGNRKVQRRDAVNGTADSMYAKFGMMLPAMSLSLINFEVNDSRQTSKFLKKKRIDVDNDGTQHMIAWNDTNVDINYELRIVAKNIEELLRITEFITSVFHNGKYYVNVKHAMYEEPISTPIVLNTQDLEIDLFGDEEGKSREIETTLSFTIKGIYTNNLKSLTKTNLDARLKIWKEEQFENLLQEYQVTVV